MVFVLAFLLAFALASHLALVPNPFGLGDRANALIVALETGWSDYCAGIPCAPQVGIWAPPEDVLQSAEK